MNRATLITIAILAAILHGATAGLCRPGRTVEVVVQTASPERHHHHHHDELDAFSHILAHFGAGHDVHEACDGGPAEPPPHLHLWDVASAAPRPERESVHVPPTSAAPVCIFRPSSTPRPAHRRLQPSASRTRPGEPPGLDTTRLLI